jgi:hypothetical protein
VLQPVGDRDKLADLIKRRQHQDYEYECHKEPMHAFCDPHGCKRKPYGVGSNGHSVDHYELGITIVMREPRIYIVNPSGSPTDKRMHLSGEELWSPHKYQVKCLDYGVVPPQTGKRNEWESLVNRNIENATSVQPSPIMQSNSYEIMLLRRWLTVRIPTFMRQGEKDIDRARLDVNQARIYFKWFGDGGLGDFCRSSQCNPGDYEKMTRYLDADCEHHKQEIGNGIRGWWRGTYSIALNKFDEDTVEHWLNAGKEVDDGTHI